MQHVLFTERKQHSTLMLFTLCTETPGAHVKTTYEHVCV